jgi:uncharacterized membrane protein
LRGSALIWAAYLLLFYFLFGVMEAWSNPPQRWVALVQVALVTAYLVCVSLPGLGLRRR